MGENNTRQENVLLKAVQYIKYSLLYRRICSDVTELKYQSSLFTLHHRTHSNGTQCQRQVVLGYI